MTPQSILTLFVIGWLAFAALISLRNLTSDHHSHGWDFVAFVFVVASLCAVPFLSSSRF